MGCLKLTYYKSETALSENLKFFGDGIGKCVRSKKTGLNYYTGGMLMPGRSFNPGTYRYGGAGGQEMDNEISGVGNSYTAEYWQYDSRLMRRWNIDPVTYPWQSSYAAFNNNPIYFNDPTGAEGEDPEDEKCKDCKAVVDLPEVVVSADGPTQNSNRFGNLFSKVGNSLSRFDKFMKSGMNGAYDDSWLMGKTTKSLMGNGDYGNYGGIEWYTEEGSPFYNGTVGQAIRSTSPMFVDYEDGSYFAGSIAGGIEWNPSRGSGDLDDWDDFWDADGGYGKVFLEAVQALDVAREAFEMANEIHNVPKVSSKLQMEIIVDEMDTLQVWRQSGPFRYSVIKDTIFVPNGTIPYETPNGNNSEYVKINY